MNQDLLERVHAFQKQGLSRKEACRNLGVAESTVRGWEKKTFPIPGYEPGRDVSMEMVEIPVIHRDYSHRDSLYVYPLGDVHLGSPAHDPDKWSEWLRYLIDNEGTSMLGTGDYLNCALTTSVSDSYEEVLPVGKAKRLLWRQLTPLKDRIDLLMPGNHEARVTRAIGDCPIEDVADFLDVPYAKDVAMVVYHVGEIEYHFYVRHGTGGGGVGARANRLQKQAQTCLADVYVSGHVHNQLVFPEEIFYFNGKNNRVERKRRLFVSSGSFMKYEAYAANAGFAPTKLGAPRIYLDGRQHDVHVSI